MKNLWYEYPRSMIGPGVPVVSDETRIFRLDVCSQCEFLETNKYCKMCGCFLPSKTYFEEFNCPIEKWKENE